MTYDENIPETSDAAGSAPVHRAPPEDPRPRSPLGVWALVVSLGLGGVAVMLSGLWPIAVLALGFAVWATLKIRPETHRGRGLAIAGVIIALILGGLCYGGAASWRKLISHATHGVLTSLDAEGTPEERQKGIGAWFAKSAIDKGAVDELIRRYEAVKKEVGPYAGSVDLGSFLLGLMPVAVSPSEKTEVGADVGEPWAAHSHAFWVRTRFRDAELQTELVLAGLEPTRMQKAQESVQSGEPTPLLAEIRFFRVP